MEENTVHIEWEIIRKATVGEATEQELNELKRWLKASEENRIYFNNAVKFYTKADVDVLASLSENKSTNPHDSYSFGNSPIRWANVVRVASVATLIFILAYFFLPTTSKEVDISNSQPILSASKNVTLILPDGSKLSLDPYEKQTLQSDQGSLEVNEGEIAYYGNNKIEETVYHTIEVPSGTTYKLVLSDSSVVHLNAKTKLTYPVLFADDTRELTIDGEAFFEVKKDTRPFIVNAKNKKVRVLGTSFNVSTNLPKQVKTFLASGSVEMSDEHNNQVILQPNQRAICSELGIKVVQAKAREELAWHNGLFSFEQEKLENIMQELATWYDLEVTYANENLKNLVFTGSLPRDEPANTLLKYFEKTKTLTIFADGNKINIKQKQH